MSKTRFADHTVVVSNTFSRNFLLNEHFTGYFSSFFTSFDVQQQV